MSSDTSAIEEINEPKTKESVDELVPEATLMEVEEPVDEPNYSWSQYSSIPMRKKGKAAYKKMKEEYGDSYTQHSSSRKDLRQAFISRSYKALRSVVPIPPARKNENENEDYADVFLAHARLYVFANIFLIYDLKRLALENLHETLKNFELYFCRTGDIISLIRYVYGNTEIPDDGKEEPLRALLAEYISIEIDNLTKDLAFRDLMIKDETLDVTQRQSLLGDYMAAVMKRV
ncbi:MAG: hypothetical protein Q9214_005278 [Letrouitia sp. 1 TL-2023]